MKRVHAAIEIAVVAGLVTVSIVLFLHYVEGSALKLGYILAFTLLIMIYLLPTINADRRHHRNKAAIAVINIFLGWSFFGWVTALEWSFAADTEETPAEHWSHGVRS